MPDWNLDLPFDTEPTRVPTGDECEHSDRGENCGRTDCAECGKDALFSLSRKACAGVGGLIDFAREVIRTEGAHGRYTPTLGMLSRLRDIERPATTPAAQFYRRYASRRAFAWAEGVIDAVDKNPWMISGDFDDQIDEQAAYMVGRLLVEMHLVNEHLTTLEAQSMAAPSARERLWHERRDAANSPDSSFWHESPVPGKPWIYPDEFVPLTSAAGAPSAPSAIPTHGAGLAVNSGPGFESRAQHRGHKGR